MAACWWTSAARRVPLAGRWWWGALGREAEASWSLSPVAQCGGCGEDEASGYDKDEADTCGEVEVGGCGEVEDRGC